VNRSISAAIVAASAFALLAGCDSGSSPTSTTSTTSTSSSGACTTLRTYRANHVSTLDTTGSNFSDTFTFSAAGVSERLSLTVPTDPASGTNDLKFTVRNATATDSLWTVAFVPTMPSMGHSSPNNVQPAYSDGIYAGTVNFTMSGDWRIYFCLERKDGSFADSSHFIDITVSE